MARARKTVEVKDIVQRSNHFFKHSKDDLKEARKAVFHFVSGILMNNNCYNGFMYLDHNDSIYGNSLGIVYHANGEGKHAYPDETRVAFITR